MSADRALFSQRGPAGPWHLVVVLLDVPASQYPEYEWADGAPIPTPTQRRDALTAIGYQAAAAAEWEWTEMDPDTGTVRPVELFAAITVHSIGGEAS